MSGPRPAEPAGFSSSKPSSKKELRDEEMLASLKLDRSSAEKRPYEEQLHDWILDNVASGRWPPDQRLPSVSKIMEHSGVGRTTANRAMRSATHEGLLEGRPGLGRYVAGREGVLRDATARLSGFLEGLGAYEGELKAQGRTPGVKVLGIRVEPAAVPVSDLLEIPSGDPVLVRERVYYADDRPVQLATSYLPDELVAGDSAIREENTGPGGIYARLVQENGIWYSGWDELVRPGRPPHHRERRLLAMAAGSHVWPVDRVARDEGGIPVELCRSLYVATPETTFLYRVPLRQVMDHFQERHGWSPEVPEQ